MLTDKQNQQLQAYLIRQQQLKDKKSITDYTAKLHELGARIATAPTNETMKASCLSLLITIAGRIVELTTPIPELGNKTTFKDLYNLYTVDSDIWDDIYDSYADKVYQQAGDLGEAMFKDIKTLEININHLYISNISTNKSYNPMQKELILNCPATQLFTQGTEGGWVLESASSIAEGIKRVIESKQTDNVVKISFILNKGSVLEPQLLGLNGY